MAARRRMGTESSLSRSALMDAVEAVMREEGYAALTARRVAKRSKLNYQLVFYYFGSMDDLILATYRRHIERVRATIEEALHSDRPIHEYWSVHSNPQDAVLNMEFMAMSNHNEAIRAETVQFGEQMRRTKLAHIAPAFAERTSSSAVTPAAVLMTLNYIGSLLALENALGISGLHDEIRTLVEWFVDQVEPEKASS